MFSKKKLLKLLLKLLNYLKLKIIVSKEKLLAVKTQF